MPQALVIALFLSPGLPLTGSAVPDAMQVLAGGHVAAPGDKPKGDQQPAKKKKPELSCRLVSNEAPRGGRIDVKGQNFGRAPIVRIAGKVTKMLTRGKDTISVQVPRDSDGGMVTVKSEGKTAECGELTIIGKD